MTRIAVSWQGRRRVVTINLLEATAKNQRFQKRLDSAISLFPVFPTTDVENWMADNIIRAFGGGTILSQPKQSTIAGGDIMMGDVPL